MVPSLEPGEQVLLSFNAAFNPSLMSSNTKKAYLTNRRLIFETKPQTSIPFVSLADLKLSKWQMADIIEVDFGQKIKFNVMSMGSVSREKTSVLYDWIKDLRGLNEVPEELAAKIRAGAKDFEKSQFLFGSKFDLSKPFSWLAMGVLFMGVLFGGMIGAGIAFLVSTAIVRVGDREDYSAVKKWAYIIASIIAGGFVFLVVAVAIAAMRQ